MLALTPSNVKVIVYQIFSNVILFWRCNQAFANDMHKLEKQQETLYFYICRQLELSSAELYIRPRTKWWKFLTQTFNFPEDNN